MSNSENPSAVWVNIGLQTEALKRRGRAIFDAFAGGEADPKSPFHQFNFKHSVLDIEHLVEHVMRQHAMKGPEDGLQAVLNILTADEEPFIRTKGEVSPEELQTILKDAEMRAGALVAHIRVASALLVDYVNLRKDAVEAALGRLGGIGVVGSLESEEGAGEADLSKPSNPKSHQAAASPSAGGARAARATASDLMGSPSPPSSPQASTVHGLLPNAAPWLSSGQRNGGLEEEEEEKEEESGSDSSSESEGSESSSESEGGSGGGVKDDAMQIGTPDSGEKGEGEGSENEEGEEEHGEGVGAAAAAGVRLGVAGSGAPVASQAKAKTGPKKAAAVPGGESGEGGEAGNAGGQPPTSGGPGKGRPRFRAKRSGGGAAGGAGGSGGAGGLGIASGKGDGEEGAERRQVFIYPKGAQIPSPEPSQGPKDAEGITPLTSDEGPGGKGAGDVAAGAGEGGTPGAAARRGAGSGSPGEGREEEGNRPGSLSVSFGQWGTGRRDTTAMGEDRGGSGSEEEGGLARLGLAMGLGAEEKGEGVGLARQGGAGWGGSTAAVAAGEAQHDGLDQAKESSRPKGRGRGGGLGKVHVPSAIAGRGAGGGGVPLRALRRGEEATVQKK